MHKNHSTAESCHAQRKQQTAHRILREISASLAIVSGSSVHHDERPNPCPAKRSKRFPWQTKQQVEDTAPEKWLRASWSLSRRKRLQTRRCEFRTHSAAFSRALPHTICLMCRPSGCSLTKESKHESICLWRHMTCCNGHLTTLRKLRTESAV
jgi:hypothetical protein